MNTETKRVASIRIAKDDAIRAEQAWSDAVNEIERGCDRAGNAKALFIDAQKRLISLLEAR